MREKGHRKSDMKKSLQELAGFHDSRGTIPDIGIEELKDATLLPGSSSPTNIAAADKLKQAFKRLLLEEISGPKEPDEKYLKALIARNFSKGTVGYRSWRRYQLLVNWLTLVQPPKAGKVSWL